VPVIGYLARFIPAKGLGLLVEAFVELRRRGHVVRLQCAGSMTESDARYVTSLQERLQAAGFQDDVTWQPNVSREEKISFLQGLTVFSVPATYSEAFGMYVIEALAAGVPVVQPRASAFPEIITATGGGRLFELGESEAVSATNLANALAGFLAEPQIARVMGERGRAAVAAEFSIERLASRLVESTAGMPTPALAATSAAR
jgi:glycosyltransferase involved in cell wall biosynthesis